MQLFRRFGFGSRFVGFSSRFKFNFAVQNVRNPFGTSFFPISRPNYLFGQRPSFVTYQKFQPLSLRYFSSLQVVNKENEEENEEESEVVKYFALLEHFLKNGLHDKAQEMIDELEQVHPDKSDMYHAVGFVHSTSGMYEQALHYFDLAISHNKKNLDAYFDKGMIYLTMRDRAKARECFQKIKELDESGTFLTENEVDPQSLIFLKSTLGEEDESKPTKNERRKPIKNKQRRPTTKNEEAKSEQRKITKNEERKSTKNEVTKTAKNEERKSTKNEEAKPAKNEETKTAKNEERKSTKNATKSEEAKQAKKEKKTKTMKSS